MPMSSQPADLEAWHRWRMDELAPASERAGAGAARDPASRHQQELAALRAQVRDAARREGYAAGLVAGREEGFKHGEIEGRAVGEQALATRRAEVIEPLVTLIEGLRQALDRLDTDIGDTLADVALAAASRLAGDALDARPECVKTLIRELLREEPLFSGHPHLRLHPDDAALIDAQLADELAAAGWQTQPDPTVTRGGCRVTGPEGELNATREVRWQALLARARRHGSAPIRDAPGDPTEPAKP
ncbi:MAG TPA: flagellar assembly protein FliH [Rhodanobacteraceae bacterium]|nr:flagellar assembly protein FliH [Rhodanobacteraceae bacterium]